MNKYFICKYYDVMYLGYNDFDSVLCIYALPHMNQNYKLNSSNV